MDIHSTENEISAKGENGEKLSVSTNQMTHFTVRGMKKNIHVEKYSCCYHSNI